MTTVAYAVPAHIQGAARQIVNEVVNREPFKNRTALLALIFVGLTMDRPVPVRRFCQLDVTDRQLVYDLIDQAATLGVSGWDETALHIKSEYGITG